jgi:hypothetical protein
MERLLLLEANRSAHVAQTEGMKEQLEREKKVETKNTLYIFKLLSRVWFAREYIPCFGLDDWIY